MSARWFLLAILTTSYGAGAFGMLGLSPLTPSLVDGFGAFVVPASTAITVVKRSTPAEYCRK